VTATLSTFSLIAIYSAMAVYLFAFIAFTLDLAKRTSEGAAQPVAAAARVGVLSRAGGSTATLERIDAQPPVAERRSSRFERVAYALTILGWILHVAGTVLRGVAAEQNP
jgi:hypothetical protein